jgi:peptidoglycan hydrolase CwlO-like protein
LARVGGGEETLFESQTKRAKLQGDYQESLDVYNAKLQEQYDIIEELRKELESLRAEMKELKIENGTLKIELTEA